MRAGPPRTAHPARLARRLPIVAVLVVAGALAGCTESPLSAPNADDARTRPGAVNSAQSTSDSSGVGRVMLSNRFAYVWADQSSAPIGAWHSPSPSYSYNGFHLSNEVRRTSVGHYEVSFPGMLHPNTPAEEVSMTVTAYGSTANRCVVQKWLQGNVQGNPNALVATVVCVNPSGVASDSRFTLLFVGNFSLAGRHGFARGNQPSAASYVPNAHWAHTTGPGPTRVTRSGIGAYTMDLTLPRPTGGLPESYFVTTIGSAGNQCQTLGWGASGVSVRCYGRATGAPADAQYDVLFVEQGRTNRRLGFARADQPTTPSYSPNAAFRQNSAGGAINMRRLTTGQYSVLFDGLQKLAGETENVQVTAYQGGFVFCNVISWSNTFSGMEVFVECRTRTGALVDNRFTVLLIG